MNGYRWILALLLALAALTLVVGCGGGDDDDGGGGSGGDDDDDDDLGPWDGIELEQLSAPDEYSVVIVFSVDPSTALAGDVRTYQISSEIHELEIESVTYDAETARATLTTGKQKLGLQYTLQAGGTDPGQGVGGDFWSADTAQLWAVDFSTPDFDEYQLTAQRAAVGDYGVVYVEQGMVVDNAQTTVEQFDQHIYPTETELFCEPGDIDDNGKVLILGLDGGPYYGGYFSSINSYPNEQTMDWWGIHSNEMEMVYINVVNGSFYYEQVVPHEFQHLLYNEEHGQTNPYWAYHDEGLAECAVHAVYGINSGALSYYLSDPNGLIGNGLSLVNWTWGLYDNYVQAYLFWTYVASRLDGVQTYGDVFTLSNGGPDQVQQFLVNTLDESFATVQMSNLIANWVQASSGRYGFGEMLSFAAHSVPRVDAGTTSLALESFSGALFKLGTSPINYPTTQGPNMLYAGIDSGDNVDLEAPFDVSGGVLLVYNSRFKFDTWPTEQSGPDLPALADDKYRPAPSAISPAWLDPPPFHPERLNELRRWQQATILRLMEQ
ncbi:MAG: hypothetical protein P9M14_03395 [Candidatus Alcyoniella australis]|nr:hypothetical protein [Candidatus Alcyoniella australis]